MVAEKEGACVKEQGARMETGSLSNIHALRVLVGSADAVKYDTRSDCMVEANAITQAWLDTACLPAIEASLQTLKVLQATLAVQRLQC